MKIVNKAVQSDCNKQKKAVHAKLMRKCDAIACVANLFVLFAAYSARVQICTRQQAYTHLIVRSSWRGTLSKITDFTLRGRTTPRRSAGSYRGCSAGCSAGTDCRPSFCRCV